MSLDLINVGIEPNDGTGDPPRVAGQKINANFAGLYQALEDTETSEALDARDEANRARANHTGTQTADSISDFAPAAAAAAPVQSVAGKTGSVTLTKADVGLGQVDNTPDADKPISAATGSALTSLANSTQAALNEKLEADDIAAFETNAQLDSRDAANRSRANHTGSQAISTVTGLQTALNAKLEAAAVANFETTTQLDARDAANRARGNHTGSQAISTVTGLQTALNTKLEAGAIANFEPTTQLDARDTANRARGNHTGTQPASTITGLAAVATSGAFADLSGRTYGFTYDQQAEPSSPTPGATWRQRNSAGLIVAEWEWSGSLWLSNERYAPLYSGALASANTSAAMSVYPKYPALLMGYSVAIGQPFASQDATNYWVFRHGGLAQSDWLTTIDVSTSAPTFLQKLLTTPVVITSPSASDNFVSKVGAAGNLRHFQAITHYKFIRS